MNLLYIYPKISSKAAAALEGCIAKADLSTTMRQAFFFAQTAHESAVFTVMEENLNYSATGLLKVFPKYFNSSNVYSFERDPQAIANRVYANRMGNGDENSGDGWRYRGRGYIQLTGKNNYMAFAKSVNKSMEDILEYAGTVDGAAASAAWFWNQNKLNRFADASDFTGLTKAINGGLNGLDHRKSELKKWIGG